MPPDALTRLVADARRLPITENPNSDATGESLSILPRSADRRHKRRMRDGALELDELKTRIRELLFELSRRVDDALAGTLERAHAWDQIDSLRIADKAVDDEVNQLQAATRALQENAAPERRALGLEAQLTLDAVMGLVSLIEKRLATLIRLRLRAGDDPEQGALLPEGRPFLDLGAALYETARRWT